MDVVVGFGNQCERDMWHVHVSIRIVIFIGGRWMDVGVGFWTNFKKTCCMNICQYV